MDQSGRAPIAAMSERETASALWPSRYGGVVVRRKSMSSTSRSAVMTVSLPLPLRKTAASSPMPETSDLFASDEDAARCRSVFIKSNSLLRESIGPRGCSCSSFILKDFDEANQDLPQLFQSKVRMRSA